MVEKKQAKRRVQSGGFKIYQRVSEGPHYLWQLVARHWSTWATISTTIWWEPAMPMPSREHLPGKLQNAYPNNTTTSMRCPELGGFLHQQDRLPVGVSVHLNSVSRVTAHRWMKTWRGGESWQWPKATFFWAIKALAGSLSPWMAAVTY